jgi:hypothetical protein
VNGVIEARPNSLPLMPSKTIAAVAALDATGNIRTIADLHNKRKRHGAIDEISPALYLEGFVSNVSLKVLSDIPTDPSHPSIKAHFRLDEGELDREDIIVRIEVFTDCAHLRRLESQDWDVIALIEGLWWLILDWKDGVATRFGWIHIQESLSLTRKGMKMKGEVRTVELR